MLLICLSILVVPYIGTWIETKRRIMQARRREVVPYIGTWIETFAWWYCEKTLSRTLYRYVD